VNPPATTLGLVSQYTAFIGPVVVQMVGGRIRPKYGKKSSIVGLSQYIAWHYGGKSAPHGQGIDPLGLDV